ncbi:hypothetical protein B0H14DRAFT_3877739 [Mycena olivaceomarginata]|nr:hypothetical protein B0H14DRAFT_3877739 [Mycena olivaceomarginata]
MLLSSLIISSLSSSPFSSTPFPVFDAGKTLARCDLRIGSTIRGSKHLSHACGVNPGLRFAILGQDHVLKSNQIRPPSLKTAPSPTPPPSYLSISKGLCPPAPWPSCRASAGNGEKTAVGVLSSQIVHDFLAACRALLRFDVSPSHHSNTASSQRLQAQSPSPRRSRCRTSQGRTQTDGSRFGRLLFLNTKSYLPSCKTTVPPTRLTARDQPALYFALSPSSLTAPFPRRTDFSPHIPSLPYDMQLYRLCPICSGPPTTTLLADTFMCQQSWGCQQGAAARSCLPVRERPLRASLDPSPPIGAPYELWGIEGDHLDPHALPPASGAICVRARGFGWVDGEEDDRGVGGRVRVPVARDYFGMLDWDGGGRGQDLAQSAEGWSVLAEEKGTTTGPETTEFQSRSENSPIVLASFHTTAVPPLHCPHSGSFLAPASSLATLSSPPRPPSAACQPLDPQHYETTSDMSRDHPRVWNYHRWRDARAAHPCDSDEHLSAPTLHHNTAPHPHHAHARK